MAFGACAARTATVVAVVEALPQVYARAWTWTRLPAGADARTWLAMATLAMRDAINFDLALRRAGAIGPGKRGRAGGGTLVHGIIVTRTIHIYACQDDVFLDGDAVWNCFLPIIGRRLSIHYRVAAAELNSLLWLE